MADDLARAELARECASYARYLTRQTVPEYVLGKYVDAHARHPELHARSAGLLDRWLLGVARVHALGAWLVDTYTAVFFKTAIVRKKWILLVAILESTAPTAEFFDVPDPGGRGAIVARLAWRAAAFLLGLGLSSIVFLPVHLLFAARPGGAADRR